MTATVDALFSLSKNIIPRDFVFALGYAGWQAGQLEEEIRQNAWLTLPATSDLVFHDDKDGIWTQALSALGINAAQLSHMTGQA